MLMQNIGRQQRPLMLRVKRESVLRNEGGRFVKKYNEAKVEHNIIQSILERNKAVESKLELKTESNSLADAAVTQFLQLTPASKLEDFIHARKFNGKSFQKVKLTPPEKSE